MNTYLIIFYSQDGTYLNEVLTLTLAVEKQIEFHTIKNVVAMLYPDNCCKYLYSIQRES